MCVCACVRACWKVQCGELHRHDACVLALSGKRTIWPPNCYDNVATEVETGQVMINKRTQWHALNMVRAQPVIMQSAGREERMGGDGKRERERERACVRECVDVCACECVYESRIPPSSTCRGSSPLPLLK